MRRVAACAALVLILVALQLMLVDRLRLPGGGVPDVALLVVVALGLTQGRAAGMLAGFFIGLGLDLAPPASHLIGQSALIFCLVGYGCGQLGRWLHRSAVGMLAAALIGAVTGETLQAVIGMIASDPRVTLPAVRHVLPAAVLCDVLLSPVVLFAVAVLSGRPVRLRPRTAYGGKAGGDMARARYVTRSVPSLCLRAGAGGPRGYGLRANSGAAGASGPVRLRGSRLVSGPTARRAKVPRRVRGRSAAPRGRTRYAGGLR